MRKGCEKLQVYIMGTMFNYFQQKYKITKNTYNFNIFGKIYLKILFVHKMRWFHAYTKLESEEFTIRYSTKKNPKPIIPHQSKQN